MKTDELKRNSKTAVMALKMYCPDICLGLQNHEETVMIAGFMAKI
jgi:hypothetical protein